MAITKKFQGSYNEIEVGTVLFLIEVDASDSPKPDLPKIDVEVIDDGQKNIINNASFFSYTTDTAIEINGKYYYEIQITDISALGNPDKAGDKVTFALDGQSFTFDADAPEDKAPVILGGDVNVDASEITSDTKIAEFTVADDLKDVADLEMSVQVTINGNSYNVSHSVEGSKVIVEAGDLANELKNAPDFGGTKSISIKLTVNDGVNGDVSRTNLVNVKGDIDIDSEPVFRSEEVIDTNITIDDFDGEVLIAKYVIEDKDILDPDLADKLKFVAEFSDNSFGITGGNTYVLASINGDKYEIEVYLNNNVEPLLKELAGTEKVRMTLKAIDEQHDSGDGIATTNLDLTFNGTKVVDSDFINEVTFTSKTLEGSEVGGLASDYTVNGLGYFSVDYNTGVGDTRDVKVKLSYDFGELSDVLTSSDIKILQTDAFTRAEQMGLPTKSLGMVHYAVYLTESGAKKLKDFAYDSPENNKTFEIGINGNWYKAGDPDNYERIETSTDFIDDIARGDIFQCDDFTMTEASLSGETNSIFGIKIFKDNTEGGRDVRDIDFSSVVLKSSGGQELSLMNYIEFDKWHEGSQGTAFYNIKVKDGMGDSLLNAIKSTFGATMDNEVNLDLGMSAKFTYGDGTVETIHGGANATNGQKGDGWGATVDLDGKQCGCDDSQLGVRDVTYKEDNLLEDGRGYDGKDDNAPDGEATFKFFGDAGIVDYVILYPNTIGYDVVNNGDGTFTINQDFSNMPYGQFETISFNYYGVDAEGKRTEAANIEVIIINEKEFDDGTFDSSNSGSAPEVVITDDLSKEIDVENEPGQLSLGEIFIRDSDDLARDMDFEVSLDLGNGNILTIGNGGIEVNATSASKAEIIITNQGLDKLKDIIASGQSFDAEMVVIAKDDSGNSGNVAVTSIEISNGGSNDESDDDSGDGSNPGDGDDDSDDGSNPDDGDGSGDGNGDDDDDDGNNPPVGTAPVIEGSEDTIEVDVNDLVAGETLAEITVADDDKAIDMEYVVELVLVVGEAAEVLQLAENHFRIEEVLNNKVAIVLTDKGEDYLNSIVPEGDPIDGVLSVQATDTDGNKSNIENIAIKASDSEDSSDRNPDDFEYDEEGNRVEFEEDGNLSAGDLMLADPTTVAKLQINPDAYQKVDDFLNDNDIMLYKVVVKGVSESGQESKFYYNLYVYGDDMSALEAKGFIRDIPTPLFDDFESNGGNFGANLVMSEKEALSGDSFNVGIFWSDYTHTIESAKGYVLRDVVEEKDDNDDPQPPIYGDPGDHGLIRMMETMMMDKTHQITEVVMI
jgi:hypothetical protein